MPQGKRSFTRREFIRLAALIAAGVRPFSPLLGTTQAEVTQVLKDAGLSFPCAVGDVTPTGAIVWLRAVGEDSVSVEYGKEVDLRKYLVTTPVSITKKTDFTAKIRIDSLEPGTTYYYRGPVAGGKPGPVCRFVTPPRPDEAANLRFAFSGDTRESFQPFSIMDSIRAMKPDFFLHLGDTIYADRDGVASELPEFWAKYIANRKDGPTQRLLSETSLYVTWDDHEVADNYHPTHPLAPIGRKAFFDYWPVRQDPGDPERLYRSFRWGKGAELFILDTRQYRDPSAGTILGRQQKQWLLESLASSKAWFKFVATSVPFSSPNRDKWGGFPEERDEILKWIAAKQIGGIVFLSADVHYAAVSKVPGELGLREVTVGPLAAPMNRSTRGTAKRFEFFFKDSYSYGLVRVHGEAYPPYAEIEILDKGNKLLHKMRFDPSSQDLKQKRS